MTKISIGKMGYVEENTYGIREVPTEFRRFGNYVSMQFPDEAVNPLIKMLASSFMPAQLEYNDITVEFTIIAALIDPQVLSYLGVSVTTTDTTSGDPRYRHQFAPVIPAQAFTPPSLTCHLEIYDEDGNWLNSIDVAGTKLKETKIKHVFGDENGVSIELTMSGQRIMDSGVTTTLLGQTSGSTADPEGVQGANFANRTTESPKGSVPAKADVDGLSFTLRAANGYETDSQIFHVNPATSNVVDIGGIIDLTNTTAETYGTVTSAGTDLTSKYKGFEITLTYEYGTSRQVRSGTNNFGAPINPYVMNQLVKVASVGLVLTVDTDDTMYALQRNKYKKIKNQSIYIRIEKFNDATDWIAFCFAPLLGATPSNLYIDLTADFPFLAIDNAFPFSWNCKDFNTIVGNDFATLRAI